MREITLKKVYILILVFACLTALAVGCKKRTTVILNKFAFIDKTGKVVQVHADHIPSGIESAKIVVLRGHLNKDSFHAHDILLD